MSKSRSNADITSDDIQKTKEYSDALDKLQASLTGVDSKLPAFADGMEAGLKAIAEKLPDVVRSRPIHFYLLFSVIKNSICIIHRNCHDIFSFYPVTIHKPC